MTLSEVNLSGYCLCELAAGVFHLETGEMRDFIAPLRRKKENKRKNVVRRVSVIECLKVKSIRNKSFQFFCTFILFKIKLRYEGKDIARR